ncbi:hypothetical protein K0M31_000244 [Melipona bicolor]|uniref:Uncharacterized protein n=1 Tax=Melipona bicolor TaxID=60889 RepID=A0AA40GD36_9HYME|nr:hypothetical protein K0M31_000244 [Melipona bicolor]
MDKNVQRLKTENLPQTPDAISSISQVLDPFRRPQMRPSQRESRFETNASSIRTSLASSRGRLATKIATFGIGKQP